MLALPSTHKNYHDFILDALPYIDDAEYDETHRKFALSMIEEEQKRFPMTKNYLRRFPKPAYDKFLSDRLKGEFQRMAEGKAINNCEAQIESMRLKKVNLELMQDHGGHALIKFNNALQRLSELEEQQVFKLRSQLFEVHSRRKRRQEEVGSQLVQMGSHWIVLVNKNIQLDEANRNLESEVKAITKRFKIEYDYQPQEGSV